MRAATQMPTVIKGYQLLKPWCQVGKTIFYDALDESTNHHVFIEEIEDEFPSLDDLVSLKNDFEITRVLTIHGILKSFSLVKSSTGVAVVKEYFDGIPLQKFIESRKLSIPEILKIAVALSSVLQDVHSQSIIHKDVNPENFLINPDTFEIRLCTFSYATQLSQELPGSDQSEKLKGSLFYISPEQTGRMNRSIDYRTDFYSLGILIYKMLCGKHPFEYSNLMELVHAHIAKLPEEPSHVDHNIPKSLSDIVMKLLSKNAEDRYQSARGLKEDLEQCLRLYEQSGNLASFVFGQKDFSPTFRISEKLYGRGEETKQLIEAFEKSRNGTLDMILVAGYSGVGKTRLINEIHKPIARENGYFTSGKFDQYNRNNPYSAIGNAFGALIRQFLAESTEDFERWKQKISGALEENGDVLIDVIPELELLIGKQPSALKLGLSETQTRFFNLFKSFIKVLASQNHPLVIFIDDLQWADSGSLDLIQKLLSSHEIKHTLLIGAYRDNEVSPSHPLVMMLDRLSKDSHAIKTITLPELTKDQVNHLIADSLHQPPSETQALTSLVMNKTRGNPFFINQFIQKLADEQLIFFVESEGKWNWNSEKISSMNITDNVVDLLVNKIQALPPQTQNALRLASCIGSRFDLDTVAIISEKEENVVATELWEAVMEDLLNPVGQRSKHFNDQLWKELGIRGSENPDTEFIFQHDRIQQAAYSLIPEAEKKKTHLQIGRLLLQKLSSNEVTEQVFDVISHFNFSSDLITEKNERIQIAKLNFIAGNRAKNSNSYQPAVSYFRAGMSVINHEDDAALYNDFLIARSECEYLCGNYEESEKMFDVAIGNATSDLEKAEVLSRKMQLYENTARQLDAIKIALEGLKLLGITLPEKPGQARILVELLKAKFTLRGKSIESLKNNIDLKSPGLILAMKILVNLWGPGYLYNQNLLVLGILRMVILSARYGNSPESALAYAFYGFVLSAQLKDFTNGNDFGKLGMWLNEKFNDKVLRAKVYVIYAGCIAHWKADLSEVIETLGKAHTVGIETNDLIYAGYATNFLARTHYMMGDPLETVYEKCKSYVHFGRQIHNRTIYYHLLTQTRMVTRLLGKSPEENVFMDSTDVEVAQKQMIDFSGKEGISLPLTWHYYFETEWYYRMEEYEKALELHAKTKKIISALLGFPEIEFLKFYHSMMLMAMHKNKPQYSMSKLMRIVKSNQKILKKAGKTSPGVFLAKYLLVNAECAGLRNEVDSAAKSFTEAKEAAEKSGITQDIGLVNERAAEFYRLHDFKELSVTLYREAIYNYRQWGAVAKVQQLEKKLATLGLGGLDNQNTSQQMLFKSGTVEASSSSLDLQSIFKASTTISGEVVFEKLLQKLMKIVLENAGAQSGSLVLIRHGQLVISARGDTKDEDVKLLNEIPIEEAAFLSQAIVQFVYHTSETIILNDAVKDERFSKDSYLIKNNPKSVLCQPIMQHGQCVAIIYLENNLAIGAFTPARIEVLNLLSGQIAVSIENAQLYNRQKELSDAYQRFVPHDFINALGHQSILQVKLGDSISQEMTVMFCDIRSYTSLAEGMTGTENFNFINSYLSLVGPVIKKHNGFINHYLGDGFIALFKDNSEDALHAAIEMTEKLHEYNEERKKESRQPIALGIGLHTGPVMMGIIGDRERHDANVISDAVNISSRLEGLTKYFGSTIVLSDKTLDGIKNRNEFQFRHLGRIRVKGKENVIGVDEVFNTDEATLREKKSQTLEMFNTGLNDYLNKRFAEAAVSLRKVVDINPQDKTARRYLENSAKFMVLGVPDDWDGTEKMDEK